MPFPSVTRVWCIHRMMRGECAGGTSIEDLAEKYPEKIIKIPIDVFEGITDKQVSTGQPQTLQFCKQDQDVV